MELPLKQNALTEFWGAVSFLKSEQKRSNASAVGGSLWEVLVGFLLQGLQWFSTGLLMTFRRFLMDSLVSNFAHRAHGITSDQLSLWFVSMCSAHKAIPLCLCVVRFAHSWKLLKLLVTQRNEVFQILKFMSTNVEMVWSRWGCQIDCRQIKDWEF